MNLDTGVAVNTCQVNFGPDGAGDGRLYRTASGECILDVGARQFRGCDEHGLCRSLNGRLTGVHNVVCDAGDTACKGKTLRFLFVIGRWSDDLFAQRILQGKEDTLRKLVR